MEQTWSPTCFNFGKACGTEGTILGHASFADIYVFPFPLSDASILDCIGY